MRDAEIVALLSDCYGFIYAAGADERVIPESPVVKFFYEANVLPTQRIARLAKEAGVKKFVVFGSYFAEFAERLPEYELRKQAYPNTRLLQEQVPVVEYEQMLPTYQAIDAHAKAEGKEHGMHMVVSGKLQTEDLFLDPKDTMPVLGIKEHDVEASIKESLKLCV